MPVLVTHRLPRRSITETPTPPPGKLSTSSSAVGQYLARQFGMFAWRIHPLIHAHNAVTGLDAFFRRLDMFMHSPRAGMLYHEIIIFVDHATISHHGPDDGSLQPMWQMYAARTRTCDLSNLDHTYFRSVDGDKNDAGEEWQNCLQWDALMTRVLNATYMRRTREAVIQRWDMDACEYWRRVEGLLEVRIDRVAKAVLAYGLESPAGGASDSFGSEAGRGVRDGSKLACCGEQEDSFIDDKFGGAIDLSSCGPNCQCGSNEDASRQGAEVNDTLYEFDFEEELRGGDLDVEHDLKFKCDRGVGPESDFGSLDSILSDATPPPASLTPSSSEASSSDMNSERILYPRLMPISTPIQSQLLTGPRPTSRKRIYPALVEESPSFATSSSSEWLLADFSAFSLALSTRTSTGMNVRDSGSPLSSSPRAVTGLTSQPALARPCEPSLLDLALALGTRGSEGRLRKREITSSSSCPSPPASPSPQFPEDRYPQVPQDMRESTVRNTVCIHPNNSTSTSGSFSLIQEFTQDPSCTRTDSPPPARVSRPPPESKKLRVMLNLRFKNPPPCDPPATPAPVQAESAIPKMRTAFSLWDAIMRPQGAPIHPSGPCLAGVDMQLGDLDSNFQLIPPTTVDCERKAACLQDQSLHELVGVCSQGTSVGPDDFESLDPSDGEWELVAGGNGKTTRRRGEKARRQRERRRIRIQVTQARDTERSALAGMACAD
ncbi:hypothetical protein V8D89_001077 [Ganoderma adspersum]